ncbi:MAG: type II toxin-antitoxin system HicA family toxin, partial [Opitutales bacterium]
GEHELQCRIQEGTLKHTLNPERWPTVRRMMQQFFDVRSEIYEIIPPSRAGGILPPASAMPFLTCSPKDLVKVCGRKGWTVKKGGKGSHVKLTKENARRSIIIPGDRREIRPGTLASIRRALDMSEQELRVFLSA